MKNTLLELLIVVCPQGKGEKILTALKPYVNFNSLTRGRGTASSEIVAALGLGEPEKDMIFSFCENKNVPLVYEILQNNFVKHNVGVIAMTIPVSAVGGNLTLQVLLGNTKDLI